MNDWGQRAILGVARSKVYLADTLSSSRKELSVFSGKRFRLATATLALDMVGGKRRAITLPADTIVTVASGPKNNDGIVDVIWENGTVAMFQVDLLQRGTEISAGDYPQL